MLAFICAVTAGVWPPTGVATLVAAVAVVVAACTPLGTVAGSGVLGLPFPRTEVLAFGVQPFFSGGVVTAAFTSGAEGLSALGVTTTCFDPRMPATILGLPSF